MLNGQFRVFLTDTTGFYMKLILKLFAIHGLKAMEAAFFRAFRTEIVPLSTVEKAALPPAGRSAEEKEGAAQAIFRLLIFLGDLARYRTFYLGLQRPEYSVALHFYRMASFFSPDWGNPHNQIAVIATYRNDDFDAVHSYLWSIVVARPFPTSKDNIGILLRRIAKREDEAGSGSFAPRNELVTERDWKEEVVRLIVTVYPDVKRCGSISATSRHDICETYISDV